MGDHFIRLCENGSSPHEMYLQGEELPMKSTGRSFEVSRRSMLSAFAALPALPMLLPASALAQLPASPAGQTAVTDPLPSWNDLRLRRLSLISSSA
jgi:hypothetical protein